MLRSYALFTLIGIGLFLIALILGWWQVEYQSAPDESLPPVVATDFGGPFTLIDQNGNRVTEADFADTYRLIYFGFTYCPSICPTELAKITETLQGLDTEIAEQIQPIFITIDPERDSPAVMKDYISMFHPRLVGLTGSEAEIAQAADAYNVYYAKANDPTMNDYTMDHSSYIFFMAPDNNLLKIFKLEDSAEDMQTFIRRRFAAQQ